MKRKQIVIGLIVILCAGLGVYALIKSRGAAAPAGEAETAPTVVSVQVGALKRMTLHRYVNGYGTVEPAPATVERPSAGALLAAPVPGVVARVNVIEGQHVEQGDVLVELNSSTATADYAAQEAARQEKLYAQQNTSLKNLQDAQTQLALLRVTAPLSGTVTRLNVKPGAAVDASTVVAEVMDLSRLAVSAAIPAGEAGELKTGQEVQVLAEPPVAASLLFISPAVDTNSGTVLIRAALPADSGLRPGQFIPLRVVTAVHPECLAAPGESVVTDEDGHSVIAAVNGDEAVQTPVQTGLRENDWVEIEGAGLQAGGSVVTVGAYGLPGKTKIRVVNAPAEETPATNSPSSQVR
jgi:membrane fusion protein, multidrug efflux system